MLETSRTARLAKCNLTPQQLRNRLLQFDELYDVGRRLAWAGLRRDHPGASNDELEQYWQEMLQRRQRGKWGRP